MLAAQGLGRPPQRQASQQDVLEAIRRMGLLQIDTINVVARSPYLVLWSRLGDYRPEWLDDLLAQGALFEAWAHAMCFLPIESFPLIRRRMQDAIQNGDKPERWAVEWSHKNQSAMSRVRAHLRTNGAVRSAEFENAKRPPGGWWNWKEEKDALEAMLLTGEVMISRRQSFQRVYDLTERVMPGWDDSLNPSSDDLRRTLDLRTVHALGVACPSWVPDYFRQKRKGIAGRLEALAEQGLLHRVDIEGFEGPAYVHSDRLELLEEAASGRRQPTHTALLSPFDPLVWDRQRGRELFGFDYMIECYTPAAKRRYGYFTLPILHHGSLIGRLDPKAHRAQGLFEVRSIHLEPGVAAGRELAADLADALRLLAAWHGTPDVLVRRSSPAKFAALLKAAL
jgi:hypothetical protein